MIIKKRKNGIGKKKIAEVKNEKEDVRDNRKTSP
jgi:hypothetical protein